ncbi:MAG: hypothetical protein K0S74_1737 [Chlamydiales bacterium]|jgi:hypothetical protein|nr:hypothetical protein [Chlamydiales bacterium]
MTISTNDKQLIIDYWVDSVIEQFEGVKAPKPAKIYYRKFLQDWENFTPLNLNKISLDESKSQCSRVRSIFNDVLDSLFKTLDKKQTEALIDQWSQIQLEERIPIKHYTFLYNLCFLNDLLKFAGLLNKSNFKGFSKLSKSILQKEKFLKGQLRLAKKWLDTNLEIFNKSTYYKKLYLNGLCVETLPFHLGTLTSLKCLSLQNNFLTQIPSSVIFLQDLRILKLRGNKFSVFPKELLTLVKIQELDLGYNKINFIPVEIGNLTELVILKLDNNKIEQIPSSFSKLKQLELLNLNNNLLNTIPEELYQLKKIRSLYLGHNPLIQICKPVNSIISDDIEQEETLHMKEKCLQYESKAIYYPLFMGLEIQDLDRQFNPIKGLTEKREFLGENEDEDERCHVTHVQKKMGIIGDSQKFNRIDQPFYHGHITEILNLPDLSLSKIYLDHSNSR